MEFTVTVEKPSHIVRKLTVRVPAQVVAQRFQKSLASVQKTAKLKGFRPGMVPLPMVQKYYGADVRHSLFHDLIEESYRLALRDQQLRAVGSPQIDTTEHNTGEGAHDHSLQEGADLTYTATVEVLPELEVKGYTGLVLTQSKADVGDADVDAIVRSVRDNMGQLVDVADAQSRLVKKGDHIDLEFAGGLVTDAGLEEKAGMKGQRVIEVGSDTLIPGFEDQLVGMKVGETKKIRVPFPADYFEKDFAGKESEFTVTVHGLKEKQLPELNDEFAKNAGYESLADMRKKAHEHLVQQKQGEADRKLKSDLLQALIDKNTFEVPQALIQTQTRVLAQDVAQNLQREGFSQPMIEQTIGSEMESLSKRAENQVRASLLLEAIAKAEKIEVKPEELEAELATLAQGSKVSLEEVKTYYGKNPSRLADLEFRMREDRTVKFLLGKAKLKSEK